MIPIPILSGITGTEGGDFTLSYPINLEPVPLDSGLAQGYMRSAPGASLFAEGPGPDRGGINWNDQHYRVMGTKLVHIGASGAVTQLGDVGGSGPVTMDYGFDRLAIRSDNRLYYWNGATLTQVTDPDLGSVIDMLWMTGYYITTDGISIVVTQLSDATQVDPLKYGSAEADPDMVVGLFKLRGELYALGRYTLQVFTNTGGQGFPFTANTGATVPVGVCGSMAKCAFLQTMAFTGSGRDEALSVYLLDGGGATKIGTRIVDDELAAVADPSSIRMEQRMSRDERRLLIHLPDKTLVYMANASRLTQQPVWYIARSGMGLNQQYRLQNAVHCYGRWICGDTISNKVGVLNETVTTHFGDPQAWQFETKLLYNQGASGIIHSLELVGLPGRGVVGSVFLSMTLDGETWSIARAMRIPLNRTQRVQYNPHKRFRNYIGLRFKGSTLAGWSGLNADIEPLRV